MESSTTPVTVEQLDGLLKSLADLDKKIDTKKEELTKLNKEYMALEYKCAGYLNELGRKKYDSPYGVFSMKPGWRVNLPASDQEKMALFEHLKERGIFEQYATVNSASLNALYMRDWEVAKREGKGMEFNMPGILAPKEEIKLNFKPTKQKEDIDGKSVSNDTV